MPTAAVHLPDPSPEPVFRLTVEQYHAMIENGVLTEDDPVELLEGVLVQKMPKNPPHRLALRLLSEALEAALPESHHFQAQEPVTLADGEPEPDGAVIRGAPRDYSDRHPGPSDVPLVIEVADAMLKRDRGIKLRSYARARIGEYWIVNLVERVVEVYKRPGIAEGLPTYLEPMVRKPGEELAVPVDGAAAIRVDEILP